MEDNLDKKIEFLYSAIKEAQELINFIDKKTAFAVTIIGSILVGLFTNLETIIKYFPYYNFWFHLSLFLLIGLLIICIWVTIRIIKPTNNPIENLKINDKEIFKINYFISINKYRIGYPFFNSKEHKLVQNFEEFSTSLNNLSNLDIVNLLTLELLKVSFIRNIKNDRFNLLILLLIITSMLFSIQYILLYSQTNYIKFILKNSCLDW